MALPSFPPGFKFGIADSDLQVIGEDYTLVGEGSEPTMWLRFAESRGIPTPDVGVNRYERWPEDIEHLKRLGVKHYRTSISMARTLQRDGEPNRKAIEWYRRYLGTLRESGIETYATLHHWELPQYAHEAGGWLRRETAHLFARHAQVVTEQLDDVVSEYFILNEPWCASMLSYYEGIHAPGRQFEEDRENLKAGVQASHYLLLAQGLAFREIKGASPQARVGTVFNYQPAYAFTPTEEDIRAAHIGDGYYNSWFLDALYRGEYSDWMLELYGEDALPQGYRADMDVIRIGPDLDVFGVNYYRGAQYRVKDRALPIEEAQEPDGPTNSLDWPIYEPPVYPEGLYDILQQIWYGYRAHGLKRMYVSENGIALDTPWDGASEVVEDERRIAYIEEHLRQLQKARMHGIPVEGYFVWTLMDNYEWAEGYRPEASFGIIHVDRATLKRVWKRSAHWYRDLIASHSG
jgi:beta-glucosidase